MVKGISVNGNNSFDRYNKWTVDVATGKTTQDFEYSNNEPDKELDNLSDGWIKHYDTNGDGKVEFLEYARTELKEFKQQYGEIDKSMMDKITNNLMNTFLRLNVDDDNDSKDVITKAEAKNFFYTMDSLESLAQTGDIDKAKPDGKITKDELDLMAKTLGEDKIDDNSNPALYATWGLLVNNYYEKFQNK